MAEGGNENPDLDWRLDHDDVDNDDDDDDDDKQEVHITQPFQSGATSTPYHTAKK